MDTWYLAGLTDEEKIQVKAIHSMAVSLVKFLKKGKIGNDLKQVRRFFVIEF
jgi:hypothetical protein